MKKRKLLAIVCILSASILFNSCIGSFNLLSRLNHWNRSIDSKFVNELVFVALIIVQAYTVAFVADITVLNSIEFWSGENPVASVGDVKKIKGDNGDYSVETLENGYSITKDGEAPVELIYNQEANTWSVVSQGVKNDLIQLNDDGTAQLFVPGKESVNISLDEQGLMAAREIAMESTYYAFR